MNYISLAVWLLRELEVVVGGGGWSTGHQTSGDPALVGEPVDVVIIDNREVDGEHTTDDKQRA